MNARLLIPTLLLLCSAVVAEDSSHAPEKRVEPFYLITDYLPPAVYSGDPMTCCFRVENNTADAANMELIVSVQDEAGKEIKTSAEAVAAGAKSTQPVQTDLASDIGAAVEFTLRMKGKTEVIARAAIKIVRDNDAWPKTALRNGRLETPDKGQVIVPVVR
jgi:hypothetical protein